MKNQKPLVIAHRGARSLAPENTLAAARKAFELGADMWELDVAVTADGELILMHDDTLERTCNASEVYISRLPWNVWDFTLAEIQALDCGSWFNVQDPFGQIAAGAVTQEDQKSYEGEKAPTLREALEYTKSNQWRVNIEIKEQPDAATARVAVEKTVALVEELAMETDAQAVISSFEHAYLEHVHELNPQLPIQLLTTKAISNPDDYLAKYDTRSFNPKLSAWSYEEIKELSDRGILFNVWTVNDVQAMKALIDANVQGIITDFPQVLLQVLAEKE
ncbi:MAG TPA: glycerophosphodiester phosphodiesterase family protein [Bellilinea sp.]|nr:glycerophosphodiester phosphodiesterase family protein [Bellilinea sp.]